MPGVPRTARRKPAITGSWVAGGGVCALLFAEVMVYGANATDLALAFSALWFSALALLMGRRWARQALAQVRPGWIGLTFAAMFLACASALTPYAPGGPHPVWRWAADWLGAGQAPNIGSIDPYMTVVELVKLAGLAAVFLIGALFGADDERAKSLLRWLLRFGLAYSVWAFVNQVTNPNELFGAPRTFAPERLSASLVSGNTAATFFGALTVLNLVDFDRTLQRHQARAGLELRALDLRTLEQLLGRTVTPLISLLAAVTCLILTLSRGGLSATAAVLVIVIGGATALRAPKGAVSVPALATTAVLGGLVLASFALNLGALQTRLSILGNDSLARKTIFAAHWAAFTASPLSGYGLGAFAHVNAMIMDRANLAALDLLGATHNVYLQWLELGGLVGAAPMFACVGLITLQIARGAVRRRRMRSWLVGVLAVLAVFLLHAATDFALEVPAMAAFVSLLLGVGCGLAGFGPVRDRPMATGASRRAAAEPQRVLQTSPGG